VQNKDMTEEKTILMQIQQLPEQMRQEVLHYIEFLKQKYAEQNQKNQNRKAGSQEGKYKLAADFDAPLEDFEEYM
jgi:translation initiation factor 2 beta subunit (eIF-2beta)/eIF-5